MKNPVVILSILVGIALLYVAYVYFTTPANELPTFFPGYDTAITRTHLTHGIASVVVALGAFVLAWFQSGKSSPKESSPQE